MQNINTLPGHSRVWIYQCSRVLTNDEVGQIQESALLFLNDWSSHGSLMDAAIEILHNCFVIVLVDEKTAPASGCGIDKSVKFIQSLEKQLNITLLERTNVAWINKENRLQISTLAQFEEMLISGEVSEDTLVFNNLVLSKDELLSGWNIPLKDSWHKKLLKKALN